MNIINLTPHAVRLYLGSLGSFHEWPSDGEARASQNYTAVEDHPSVLPCGKVTYGEVAVYRGKDKLSDFPPPQDGVFYIVSTIAAAGLRASDPHRNDLLVPDTGPESVVRENGQVFGVRRFILP